MSQIDGILLSVQRFFPGLNLGFVFLVLVSIVSFILVFAAAYCASSSRYKPSSTWTWALFCWAIFVITGYRRIYG